MTNMKEIRMETKAKPAYPTPMEMVKYYYETAGITPNVTTARCLVVEEYCEWLEESSGTEGELKELTDLVYVIYGYALAQGYDLDEALCRVHSNNIGRMTQPDGTIKRRKDGKIIKNPDYPKVDLSDLLG